MTANANPRSLEFRRLTSEWRKGIEEFCSALERAGDTRFFRPHPFTADEFDRLVGYAGKDLYYVAVEGPSVLGYGLLRGWDEGYAIPSLGIAIDPKSRGYGLGVSFMEFLHAAAVRRGAQRMRLKVNTDNSKAIDLYKRLGYSFDTTEGPYYVGYKQLRRG